MRIIPAIDIIEGKCVRLTKGDYSTKKIYNENPIEVAKQFEDNGIEFVHVVDLDGAKEKHIVNYNTLEAIATKTNLSIDFGGGLGSDDDLRIAFESGAQQITGGSIAVNDPERFDLWLNRYGGDRIILGADYKEGKIATHGWMEVSEKDVITFIEEYVKKGVQYTICTDISKDGLLKGPSIDTYKEIIERININLIASGGIASMDDVVKVAEIGCEGVIIGKAIYEGKISLAELSRFILNNE
ncbi:MAG: 1-(5-phosphoribosyl)-5-[(5-phosphoribosylamino)methylideneamino]imidazole-4-carboxamide isomerase [Bacteroidales bacterium]|nr:1-(5-phosphoribosyl)-5-[(5-phosphoribosylamino)methylideneamino]imidazole-4-carboxamide isomerase [Bacteroidales bacterium]